MADVGPDFRKSDRYVTPGVIIAGLIVVGVVLVVVAGSVAYLTARGIDPDPMVKLVVTIGGGLFSLLTFTLQLVGRPTAAKTERNTGVLAAHVGGLAAAVTAAAAPAPAPMPPPYPEGPATAFAAPPVGLPPVPVAVPR